MTAKLWIITTGAVVLVTAGIATASLLLNKHVNETLALALVSIGSGATGNSVSIGDTQLSLWTGEGTVEKLTVPSSAGYANKNTFVLSEISFKVRPLSLMFGPLNIETVTVGAFKAGMDVSGTQSNMTAVVATASAYATAGGTNYSSVRLIVEALTIGKGSIKRTVEIPEGSHSNSYPFPEMQMAAIGGNEGGISPADFAQHVITNVSSRVISIASP